MDELYEQLEEEIRTTPRHDALIVIGYLNARVGDDNTGRERAMGTHGLNLDVLTTMERDSLIYVCRADW